MPWLRRKFREVRKSGPLDEIRQRALDDDDNLTGLLRRCMVLGSQLRHKPLQEWVNRELNGYSQGDELPDYRFVSASLAFSEIAWGQIIGPREFPLSLFPEDMRS